MTSIGPIGNPPRVRSVPELPGSSGPSRDRDAERGPMPPRDGDAGDEPPGERAPPADPEQPGASEDAATPPEPGARGSVLDVRV